MNPKDLFGCTAEDFDRLIQNMGHKIVAEACAKLLGYPSARAWADAGAYQGRDVRGKMKRGSYTQPCNEVHGEIARITHTVTPDPSNGGQYACSCGMRWMTLDQAGIHRRQTLGVEAG